MFYSLTTLKMLVVRDSETEEVAFVAAQLAAVSAGYVSLGLVVPEWLVSKQREIKIELDIRVRADKERLLKTMRQRRESLKTADEKRADLDKQIEALAKELG